MEKKSIEQNLLKKKSNRPLEADKKLRLTHIHAETRRHGPCSLSTTHIMGAVDTGLAIDFH